MPQEPRGALHSSRCQEGGAGVILGVNGARIDTLVEGGRPEGTLGKAASRYLKL